VVLLEDQAAVPAQAVVAKINMEVVLHNLLAPVADLETQAVVTGHRMETVKQVEAEVLAVLALTEVQDKVVPVALVEDGWTVTTMRAVVEAMAHLVD
jgi:hypothetical protein